MNRMHVWAKIAMAMLGLYTLIHLATYLWTNSLSLIYVIGRVDFEFTTAIYICFLIAWFFLIFLIILTFQLLFRGDKWAPKIVGDYEEDLSHEQAFSLPAACRIAAFSCGVIMLFRTVPGFIRICYELLAYLSYNEIAQDQYPQKGFPYQQSTIITLLRLALSVYLICGAPHFVRWQIKKTAALSENTPTDLNAKEQG